MMMQEALLCILLPLALGDAQMIYGRAFPLDAVYATRRMSPRNAPEENGPSKVRLPFYRYFPQVDTQAAPAPAPAPARPYLRLAAPAVLPPASTYRLSSDSIYALPPQWSDGVMQQTPYQREDYDYGPGYEYDEEVYPSYSDDMYVQAPAEVEGDLYDDLMVNYLLRELHSQPRDQMETVDVQRRSQEKGLRMVAPIPISSIIQANIKQNESQTMPAPPTVLPSSLISDAVSETPSAVKSSVLPPYSSAISPATAPLIPPPSPRSGSQSTSILSGTPTNSQESHDLWKTFTSAERGQKEFPLYRPPKTNAQSAWSALEEQLSRAKNSSHKSPIPLLKKLIASHHADDPLTNQLTNLKFHKP